MMSYAIDAIKICNALKMNLRTGMSFQIHSCFQHAINLKTQDGLFCSMLSQGKPLGPSALEIPVDDLRLLGEVGASAYFSEQFFHFDASIQVGISKAEAISLELCPSSDLDYLSKLRKEIRLFINWYPVKSFFQIPDNEKRLKALSLAFSSGYLEEELEKIVGLGNGLTPSGDDFCVGLAWALMVLKDDRFPEFATQLLVLSSKTTDISAVMFHNLQKGLFIEPLVMLGRGVSLADFHQLLNQIASIGHSSGMDTLYGMLWGLELLNKSEH